MNTISPVNIAMTGLAAESARMSLIADNIANATTTKGADGKPYRRQYLLTQAAKGGLGGVRIGSVARDAGPLKRVYEPTSPDAQDGYVNMPNVDVPREMIDLVSASRAYQANAAVMKRYQDNVDVALELLK
jgi:flagellar basal-body rod protein FlgC